MYCLLLPNVNFNFYSNSLLLYWHLFCCCSVTQLCPTLCAPVNCSTPSFLVLHHLPELAQTHVHWFGDTIQQYLSLSPLSPPASNLSQRQGLFQRLGSSHQVAKVLELYPQPQSLNEYLLLISFRITWLDLLAVQGNLKILLQHHSLKASVIQHSDFVMVQLSHPYMTMGKTIALTIATFVGKDFISRKYSFPLIVSI